MKTKVAQAVSPARPREVQGFQLVLNLPVRTSRRPGATAVPTHYLSPPEFTPQISWIDLSRHFAV